ncbi:cation/H(+) antiporter 15-like isoform X1 [Salvia hispanica]|nr:cation/H(+) antiporter 15-like isoform X1 [Salvia hispanica]
MGSILFPARSMLTLETVAVFGIMFFLFAIGVRTDTRMMVRPERQAVVLGFTAIFVTLVFSLWLTIFLATHVAMDKSLAKALPFFGAAQCLTAFANVSCLLIELKMASSDLGRIASSTAMFTDLVGMCLFITMAGVLQSAFDVKKSVQALGSAFLFVSIMVLIIRPQILKLVKKIPAGKPLGHNYVFTCFTCILIVGLITEVIGQHFMLGPLVLGFITPDGPPLGAPMISKLDLPIGKFLYPTFLTTSGIKTNIFSINLRSFAILAFVITSCCITKILAIVIASRFCNIGLQDSVVVGLVLNARGISELLMFNLWRDGGILTDQEFALSVISVVGVMAVITPLIRLLYDPARRIMPTKRRTIQHSKREAGLRILLCIHNQDNVPTMVNLLEASHATEMSPIGVVAVVLEEVVGRITGMLVSHQTTRSLDPNNARSNQIVSALRQYELYNQTCVTIQPFSIVSPLQTVHDDIFRVAMDESATVIILPFHKHWEIDGSIGSINKCVQSMNVKVLEHAPCSVGILVDRGVLTGQLSILSSQFTYRVAVIYIGGADDAESLWYGARIAGHDNATLTVIRYLLYGCDSARERKHDNSLIDEVRQQNIENQDFVYQEQVVKDGVGLASSLRALENCFDLLIVGRNHQSQILLGLGEWSECPELGVVGDILAAPDFGSTASVLVL